MTPIKLHNILDTLITTNRDRVIEKSLEENTSRALKMMDCTIADVRSNELIEAIELKVSEDDNVRWRFVSVLSRTLLEIIQMALDDDDFMMSVGLTKSAIASIEFVVCMGLLPTLIPGVGVAGGKRGEHAGLYEPEETSPEQKYDRLKAMCNLFSRMCRAPRTKAIVYGHFLKDHLAALFQLSAAPIVRPGASRLYDGAEFTMTEELYARLQSERAEYAAVLVAALAECPRPLLIRELLILRSVADPPPPTFMRTALSKRLSDILMSKDGLLHTMKCFFDNPQIDVGQQWRQVLTVQHLISEKHGPFTIEEYLDNMCKQLKDSLHAKNNNTYSFIAAAGISALFVKHPKNRAVLDVIASIVDPFKFNEEDLSNGTLVYSAAEINRMVKLIDFTFASGRLEIPTHFLNPIICHLFELRTFNHESTKIALDSIIMKHFQSGRCQNNHWFNAVIFKKPHKTITINKNILYKTTSDGIQVSYKCGEGNATTENAVDCILQMIEDHSEPNGFSHAFFAFCLSSMMKLGGKSENTTSRDLLLNEDEPHDLISKESEHLLILFKALEKLSGMKQVFRSFKKDPSLIVEFISSFLNDYTESLNSGRKFKNEESIMICLSLATVLVSEHSNNDKMKSTLSRFDEPIKCILQKSTREDIKFLCNELILILTNDSNPKLKNEEPTKFERAVNNVCDPLLPTRAHGIMQLTKLIDRKDAETISKKHYVQCIFEENLKSDDSYLYLCAINGLAAMASYSTEDVLEALTREFSNEKTDLKGSNEEQNEANTLRMKIGEVLVKVTKKLGDMAANHKTLLLNTFLNGCKDGDDLIRASSLSNLAEVARVLTYKLGPVLYEILNCVNSILETDKSQECRRASVMVVSSLLRGLGREALYYLREAMLPIYKTLKQLYSNESEDDTVRLHAQIGLDELNTIVKGMIFSPVKLQKEIIIPNIGNNEE